MQNRVCDLTGKDFELSREEYKFLSLKNLDLPSRSEIERLRMICSVIPVPDFYNKEKITHSISKLNCSFYDIKENPKSLDFALKNGNVASLKNYYLEFISSFKISKFITNNGDPSLYGSFNLEDSAECNFCQNCIGCYECVSCYACENIFFSRLANNCINSLFLDNCVDCKNCMFCSNLRQAEYCIFNKKVSVDEYNAARSSIDLSVAAKLYNERERFETFLKNQPILCFPKEESNIFRSNSLKGFSLGYPKEKTDSSLIEFYSRNNERSSCLFASSDLVDSYAAAFCFGPINNLFNSGLIEGRGQKIYRSFSSFGNLNNIDLCISCNEVSNLFACVGLNESSYCIFNHQLSKKDYKIVRARLEQQMKEEGWNSYFLPSEAKILPYNKSLAGILFPLNKIQAELIGYSWDLSQDLVKVPELEENEQICEILGIPFNVSEFHSDFCERNGIALPVRSQYQRFVERLGRMTISSMRKVGCSMSERELKVWDSAGRVYLSNHAKYF